MPAASFLSTQGMAVPVTPHRHGRSTARTTLHARKAAYISNAHTVGEGMAEALPGPSMLKKAPCMSNAHTGCEGSEAMECVRPCGGLQGRLLGWHNLRSHRRHGNSAVPQQRESPLGCQELFGVTRLTQAGNAPAGGPGCQAV